MAKSEKSFEENLTELEQLVKKLENGNEDLDNAINCYADAMKLAKICGEKLKNAEEKVNKILTESGTLEDFTIDEEK